MKDDSKIIARIDNSALFCLGVLIFVLPIAHTITIRSLAIAIPLVLLIFRYVKYKDFTWGRTSFELPFVLIFAAVLMSLPNSIDLDKSLKEMWRELLTPIALFYTVYFSIKKEKDAVSLLLVLFFGSLIFSAYSFYDFYMHDGTWLKMTYKAGGLRDPGGGQAAAIYHTTVIPFLFWGLFFFRERKQRALLILLLALNITALYITFTRAAYLALALQAIVILWLLIAEKKWKWCIAISVILSILVFTQAGRTISRGIDANRLPSLGEYLRLSPEEISDRYSDANYPGAGHRLAMWKTAIDRISETPFHAHGYGRFLFGRSVRTEKNSHFIYSQTHNTFIGTAFELGVQGLVVFLWMIFVFFRVCWKQWRITLSSREGISHYLSASLLTMMAGYWVNNFFGSFDAGDSKLLFMLLLGIGMAIAHKTKTENI